MSSRMRAALALAGLFLLACGDEAGPTEAPIYAAPADLHFDDGYIALFFDNTLVDVWAGGQVVGNGDVVVGRRAPTAVTATFHDAEGNMVRGLDDYELTMVPVDPALLEFTRKDAFAGTLSRITGGKTTLRIALYNVETQTFDFGPFPVPVTVER